MRFLAACLLLPLTLLAAPEKPNVLLIMADDLGFSDLGCYGSEIETPNLDSIAANGLKFSQFYNTGRCWPTRGSLLTGFYAQQIRRDTVPGVPSGGGNRGLRPDFAQLLPNYLKPAGYRSYHTGKWHIDGMPIEEGFDRSYYLKDQGRFFNPTRHHLDDQPLPPVEKNTDFYATIALADHAIGVLTEHEKEHTDSPFFHYLAFAAPHFPLHALPEDIAHYAGKYDAGWEVLRQQRWQRMKQLGILTPESVENPSSPERDLGPPYHFPDDLETLGNVEVNLPLPWNSLTAEQQKFQAGKMELHAAMIHRMDLEIGRVFDQIKAMGQWDNTLVIFLSDNGASAEIMVRDDGHDPAAPMGSAASYLCLGPGWSTAANTPFRRHKTWTHEGGIATPLLLSWPDGIAARGEMRRQPGHVIDIVPTLLELAGAPSLPESPGISLSPTFSGSDLDRDTLWWFHDGHKAIRIGDWKAVAPIAEPWELYDLSTDRGESLDLAIPQAEKLKELVATWNEKMDEFTEFAKRDIDPKALSAAPSGAARFNKAQEAARPKRTQHLLSAETFRLEDRHTFIMKPEKPAEGNPWIFYAPTRKGTPDKAEQWMHEQFLAAGVAVAGIDVGESYGSPHAFPFFDSLFQEMLDRGYGKKPALLGRSRGGLWVSSWAIAHPERVAGIGGIYPVFDFTSYPKTKKAAPAFGLSEKALIDQADKLNPIHGARALADAKIPVYIIHGTDDKLVPFEPNSEALETIYAEADASDLITIDRAEGQGHSFWEGFFTHQPLVDFLIDRAKGQD